jgi:uncharacterized membrane protein YgcG
VVRIGRSGVRGVRPRHASDDRTDLRDAAVLEQLLGQQTRSRRRTLSINTTIPVRSRHAELDASFDELGPHRFELAVERTNASGVPDCYLETRYNATFDLTDDAIDRYSLLVTYDGVLVAAYFADPDGSGASHGLVPESRYAPQARNVTGGVSAGGSGGDENEGDTGGGSAGGGGGGTSGGSG